MRLSARHPVLFFAVIAGVSAALAALALWVLSHARAPFDYMVVGTLIATVALAVAFAVTALRTARRSARPSGSPGNSSRS